MSGEILLFQWGWEFPAIVGVDAGAVLVQRDQEDALLHVGRVYGQHSHEEEVATDGQGSFY